MPSKKSNEKILWLTAWPLWLLMFVAIFGAGHMLDPIFVSSFIYSFRWESFILFALFFSFIYYRNTKNKPPVDEASQLVYRIVNNQRNVVKDIGGTPGFQVFCGLLIGIMIWVLVWEVLCLSIFKTSVNIDDFKTIVTQTTVSKGCISGGDGYVWFFDKSLDREVSICIRDGFDTFKEGDAIVVHQNIGLLGANIQSIEK